MKNKIGIKYLKLGEIAATITKGTTPTTNGFPFIKEGINFYKVENIFNGIINKKSNLNFISEEANNSLERSKLRVNDILFSIAGTIGNVALVREEDLPANVNQALAIIRGYEDHVLTEYLLIVLNSDVVRTTIKKARGVALYNISLEDLKEMVIPVPSFNEQKKISSIINKADSIRKKRQETIRLADEFLRATFLDMFGDPVSNKKNYPIKTLSEICTKITDGTHDTPERLKEGVKFITGKHIRSFIIDFENSDYVTNEVHKEIYRRCNPEYGDILYTNIGVNLGTAAMNTVQYEFSMKNVALLKPDFEIISSRFVEHVLNFSAMKETILRKASLGGAQQFMSLAIINNITLPIPPIEFQTKFASIVEQTEINKVKHYLALTESENLFSSLMQRAFRGEL